MLPRETEMNKGQVPNLSSYYSTSSEINISIRQLTSFSAALITPHRVQALETLTGELFQIECVFPSQVFHSEAMSQSCLLGSLPPLSVFHLPQAWAPKDFVTGREALATAPARSFGACCFIPQISQHR